MKYKNSVLLAAFIALCSSQIAGAEVIAFTRTTPASDFTSVSVTIGNATYDKLSVKGCFTMEDRPGSPAMPANYVNILVPFNATVTGIRITDSIPLVLPGIFNPFPAQPPVSLDGQAAPGFVDPDPAVYRSNGGFPGRLALIKDVTARGENKVVAVEMFPLQYDPSNARLTLYTSVSLEIEYILKNGAEMQVKRRSPQAQDLMDRSLAASIGNKSDLARFSLSSRLTVNAVPAGSPASASPSVDGGAVDYVIITSEELAPQFQVLADWKTQKGIYTVVKTTRWVDDHYRGADLQEKIRHFIQDAWVNWGTVLVLLGGDTSVIPARYVPWNSWPQYIPDLRIPADIYYSDVVDTSCSSQIQDYDFDSNHDGQYGDVMGGDVLDLQSDLFLGRAPVSTEAQARAFVGKVLAYEKTPLPGFGSSFLMLADGGFAWSPESINLSPLQDSAPWIDSYELYRPAVDSVNFQWSGDQNLNVAAARSELNKGYNIVYHVDHGGNYQLGMASGGGGGWLYRADADRLVNSGRPSVFLTPACSPNAFDYDCFSRHLLNNPAGGAAAFIGNSRVGWISQSYMCQMFFTGLYQNGQRMLGQSFISMQGYRDPYSLFSMNLMGDPSMMLWTDEPKTVSVDIPGRFVLGDSLLKVELSGPASGEQVQVAVFKKNEVFKVVSAAVPSSVTLPVFPSTEGLLTVTVTGANCIPSQSACLVVASDLAHPVVTGYVIRDRKLALRENCIGNNDGQINPGETVALFPTLTNNGQTALKNSFIVLRSNDPLVMVADSLIGLPLLEPGQTMICDSLTGQNFTLAVSPLITSDRPLVLTAVFSAANGMNSYHPNRACPSRSQVIKTMVLTDSLVIASYVLSCAAGQTQGNKCQTAILDSVVIANLGTGPARDVTVSLSPVTGDYDDSLCQVLRFGDIQAGKFSMSQKLALKTLRSSTMDTLSFLLTIRDAYGREHRKVIRTTELPDPVGYIQTRSLPSGRVQINWQLNGDGSGFKGYNLYRKTYGQPLFAKVNLAPVVNSRTYTDDGLLPNTNYVYTISVVDSFGAESALFPCPDTVKTQLALAPGFPAALGNGNMGSRMWSSPAAGDINRDGFEEIVLGSDDGRVYAFDHLGMPLTGWPVEIGGTIDQSSPALADLDGDGYLEIVTGSGGWYTVPGDGKVHVLRYDGTEQPGWPQNVCGDAFASAAVADLNNDGRYEVVAATTGGYVYAWEACGTLLPGWPVYAGGPVWAAPAVGNLDGDPRPETIVTANCGGTLKLLVLKYDGTDLPGWPLTVQSVAGYALASPVLADMDGDGQYEILLGAETSSPNLATHCYAFKADGSQLPGWPVMFACGTRVVGAPAISDLDGDGHLDAAFIASDGLIRAYSSQGINHMLWEVQTGSNGRTSPITADIDDDGKPEVLLTTESGYLYAYKGTDGSPVPGFPLWMEPSWSAPVVSDIDRDGKTELLAFGWGSHKLFAWELGSKTTAPGSGWSSFRGNMMRNGCYSNNSTLSQKCSSPAAPNANSAVKASWLGQNYPNPVSERTAIGFQISQPGWVRVNIYNLAGQLVKTLADGERPSGNYSLGWDLKSQQGRSVASGTYIYRLEAPGFSEMKRMLVLR